MSGIYIHIPFCRKKCAYCDFYSLASTTYLKPTLSSIQQEMHDEQNFFKSQKINTIYIGGGTPSLLTVQQLEALFNTMSSVWDLSSLGEVSFEANPDDVNTAYLRDIKNYTPINRLSMGVQSLNDSSLKMMNRRHNSATALQAYHDARNAGFDNISLDLIYGLPNSEPDSWQKSVEGIAELAPEHISAYHLSIEPNTKFGQMQSRGQIKAVSEPRSLEDYQILCSTMQAHGYEHYEISNFALPGKQAIHNSSYWNGEPYLGLGPGAHSFNSEQRRWCNQSVSDYIKGVEYEHETLDEQQKYTEFIMLSLRINNGVNIALLEKKFGKSKKNEFLKRSQKFIDSSLMLSSNDSVKINPHHWLSSDYIIGDIMG